MIRRSFIKYILFFAGLVFLLTLAAVSYRIGSMPGFFEKQDPNEFIYDNFSTYVIHNDLLYEQNREYLRTYSIKTGAVVWEIKQALNNPLMKVINNELIAYEKNGNTIQRLDKRGVAKETSISSGQIYSLIQANENLTGVIYKREGYKTSLLLIDKAFSMVFERAYSDSYVADAVFISKSRIAILLNTSFGEVLRSYIEVVDINSGNVVFERSLGDRIFSGIIKTGKDEYLFISSNEILMMDENHQIMDVCAYSNKEAVYDIAYDNGSIYVLVGEMPLSIDSVTKALRIEVISKDGSIQDSLDVAQMVESISMINNKITGISGAQIFVYSKDGEFLYNTSSDDIIEEIIGYKKDVYFLYDDRIEKKTP